MNVHQGKDTYWFLGATLAAALALGIVAFALPAHARAFSFFDWFTSSVEAGSSATVPDATLEVLESAKNTDPNPNKGQRDLALTGGSALISEAGPDGTPPDVYAPPVNGTISTYIVKDGDTLSEIASMHGVSVNTILWANNLKSTKDIHSGDTLVILPVTGIQHVVKSGETLASLAKTYGGDAGDIALFNGLSTEISLTIGASIIIPGGELTQSPSVNSSGNTSGSSVTQGGGFASLLHNIYGTHMPVINGYFGNPVPGGIITQGIHQTYAVDIGAPVGTPVYAAADGTVIVSRASGWNGGYGDYVVISHANGTQTLYAHMNRVVTSVGTSLSKGALIGYVGKTGNATGSHTHFEVRGAANPFRNCAVGTHCSPQ